MTAHSTEPDPIAELEAAVGAATPGPWLVVADGSEDHRYVQDILGTSPDVHVVCTGHGYDEPGSVSCADARYIAAANPAAVGALLREREELRAALEQAVDALRLTREYVDPTGELLPALPGWSWFDATERARRALRADR